MDDESALRGSPFDTHTTRGEASQRDLNRWFYTAQWATRRDYVEKMIAEGEVDARRAIQRLNQFERRNMIAQAVVVNPRAGQIAFTPSIVPITVADATEKLPTGVPVVRESSMRGKPQLIPYYCGAQFERLLVDFISNRGPFDAILELGTGYGRNLFEVWYAGGPQNLPYWGGELADAGIELGRSVARLQPAMNVQFFKFDWIAPDLSALPRYGRLFVFTCHTIEQVQRLGIEAIRAIAGAAGEVVVVHLEPFGFQATSLGPATEQHRAMMKSKDWNENLFPLLLEAKNQGLINFEFAAAEPFFSETTDNPTSLAVWSARNPA